MLLKVIDKKVLILVLVEDGLGASQAALDELFG